MLWKIEMIFVVTEKKFHTKIQIIIDFHDRIDMELNENSS